MNINKVCSLYLWLRPQIGLLVNIHVVKSEWFSVKQIIFRNRKMSSPKGFWVWHSKEKMRLKTKVHNSFFSGRYGDVWKYDNVKVNSHKLSAKVVKLSIYVIKRSIRRQQVHLMKNSFSTIFWSLFLSLIANGNIYETQQSTFT